MFLLKTKTAAESRIRCILMAYRQEFIVQEYIKEAKGADIRVLVVDDRVVGAMKRQGKEGDFRSNLHRGGTASTIYLKQGRRNKQP